MSWPRRVLVLATAVLVGLAGALALATPAGADTVACRTNHKKFSLPHKPDLNVDVNLCVIRESQSGRLRAYTSIRWWPTTTLPGGTRFNDFVIKLRLERHDKIKKSASYDVVVPINTERNSARNYYGVWVSSPPRGGWSADGVVVYDIHDDGLGDVVWNLTGSSVIG